LAAVFAWPVAAAARFAVKVAPLFAFAAEVEPPLASALKSVLALAMVAAFGRLAAVAVEAAVVTAAAAVTGGVPSAVPASALALLGAEAPELAGPVAVASPCGFVLAVPLAEGAGALAGSLDPALESPVFAAVALDVCSAAGGELAFAAPCGGLAGAAVLASSQAENGCDSLSWLLAVAWARWDAKSEAAAETSDAILGILGTVEPLQDDIRHSFVCNGRATAKWTESDANSLT
jgi:hypothetical protein